MNTFYWIWFGLSCLVMVEINLRLWKSLFWPVFWAAFLLVVLFGSVLWAAYESQHSPHLVTRSINGKVISSFTTTNSEWVETYSHAIPTAHGIEFQPYYVTNHYWTVWSIWK